MREHGRGLDGRTTCADRLQAPAKGEGAARCRAYEARGYKQAGQTDRRVDMQADGPNRAKIARGSSNLKINES